MLSERGALFVLASRNGGSLNMSNILLENGVSTNYIAW